MNIGEEYALPVFRISASLSMLLGLGIMLTVGSDAAPGAAGFSVVNAVVGVLVGLLVTGIALSIPWTEEPRPSIRATSQAPTPVPDKPVCPGAEYCRECNANLANIARIVGETGPA